MCIIIVNKKGTLPFSYIEESYAANPDGTGIAYSENNKLKVVKFDIHATDEEIYRAYLKIRKSTDLPILLHFRIGTSGPKNLSSVHPFFVNQNLLLAHNGIIRGLGNAKMSDTKEFVNLIQQAFDDNFLSNKAVMRILESMTDGSKVVFMDNTGKITFLHEEAGHWQAGSWFSNYSYIRRKYSVPDIYNSDWYKKYGLSEKYYTK